MAAAAILKIQKHHISAAVQAISTKFGTAMLFGPLYRSDLSPPMGGSQREFLLARR